MNIDYSYNLCNFFLAAGFKLVKQWVVVFAVLTSEVLYDPSVTAHATVGDIAFDKACTYSDPTIKGCEGLMYIKENVLYYEIAC